MGQVSDKLFTILYLQEPRHFAAYSKIVGKTIYCGHGIAINISRLSVNRNLSSKKTTRVFSCTTADWSKSYRKSNDLPTITSQVEVI